MVWYVFGYFRISLWWARISTTTPRRGKCTRWSQGMFLQMPSKNASKILITKHTYLILLASDFSRCWTVWFYLCEFQLILNDKDLGLICFVHLWYFSFEVTLEHKDLWTEFNKHGTEMVITKSGRWVNTLLYIATRTQKKWLVPHHSCNNCNPCTN